MAGQNGKMTQLQEPLIAHLLRCGNMTQAAKATGIDRETVRVWMQDPGFAQAYAEARRELLQGVIQVLQSSMLEAVQVLQRLMLTSESEWMQAQCAQTLLAQGLRAVELYDTEQRLARLEAMLERYCDDEA